MPFFSTDYQGNIFYHSTFVIPCYSIFDFVLIVTYGCPFPRSVLVGKQHNVNELPHGVFLNVFTDNKQAVCPCR